MNKNLPSLPRLITYEKILLPANAKDLEREKVKENLILQAQGEPIEIEDNENPELLMKVLEIVRKVAPEAILKLNSGEKILLFSFFDTPVLRPGGIITFPSDIKIKHPKTNNITNSLEINLEKIFNQSSGNNFFEKIKSGLKKIKEEIKPTRTTVLIGERSSSLFLLTQLQLYGITKELWYKKNSKAEKLKIF